MEVLTAGVPDVNNPWKPILLYVLRSAHTISLFCIILRTNSESFPYKTLNKNGNTLMYKLNIEVSLRKHCCCANTKSITCSQCVSVAPVIQHVHRMPPFIMCSLACLAVQ